MSNQHPITPPPELVQEWYNASPHANEKALQDVAACAAQWGAERDFDAVCDWVLDYQYFEHPSVILKNLRTALRPKSLSLKEQALAELAEWENIMNIAPDSPIRRAIEQLPDS